MPSREGRTLHVILIAISFFAGCVRADIDPVGVASVHGHNHAVPEAHGWVVLPRPGEDGFVLVHLPPRHTARHSGIAGVARRVRSLAGEPVAMAADGRRVYMVFDGDPRKMLSLDAARTPVDGIWRETPADRMTPHTPLPSAGEVLGLAVASGRPVALLRLPGRLRLLGLDHDTWNIIELPETLEAASGRWVLLSDHAGPVLLHVENANATLWRLDGESGWRKADLTIPPGSTPAGLFRGQLVLVATDKADPAGSSLLLAGPAGLSTIASIELPTPTSGSGLAAVVFPDSAGRLALVWAEDAESEGKFVHKIREISLSSGNVLYDGPVERIMPVSAEEFRLLSITLVLVLVVSLFVVLRRIHGRDAITLPAGWALAAPGRRFVATVLDVLICAIPVSKALGVPMQQIFTAGVLLNSGEGWIAIPAVFAVGVVYGAITESLFAGTIGKLIVGCRVVRVGAHTESEPQRLGPAACFVRNLIKWVLPPVAALAFLEPSARHRGDLIARSVVVVRLEPPEEGTPDDHA